MSLWLEPAVFPVVLDSCVLYPYTLRDLLLEAANFHLYRVHWSAKILEDTLKHLVADRWITQEHAHRLRSRMEAAFPEAMVDPPAHLAQDVDCHGDDRHVVAAALAAKAEVVVTFNTRHFPGEALAPLTIEAITPDQFLNNLLDLHPQVLGACLQTVASRQREPSRRNMDFVLESLKSPGGKLCASYSEIFGWSPQFPRQLGHEFRTATAEARAALYYKIPGAACARQLYPLVFHQAHEPVPTRAHWTPQHPGRTAPLQGPGGVSQEGTKSAEAGNTGKPLAALLW